MLAAAVTLFLAQSPVFYGFDTGWDASSPIYWAGDGGRPSQCGFPTFTTGRSGGALQIDDDRIPFELDGGEQRCFRVPIGNVSPAPMSSHVRYWFRPLNLANGYANPAVYTLGDNGYSVVAFGQDGGDVLVQFGTRGGEAPQFGYPSGIGNWLLVSVSSSFDGGVVSRFARIESEAQLPRLSGQATEIRTPTFVKFDVGQWDSDPVSGFAGSYVLDEFDFLVSQNLPASRLALREGSQSRGCTEVVINPILTLEDGGALTASFLPRPTDVRITSDGGELFPSQGCSGPPGQTTLLTVAAAGSNSFSVWVRAADGGPGAWVAVASPSYFGSQLLVSVLLPDAGADAGTDGGIDGGKGNDGGVDAHAQLLWGCSSAPGLPLGLALLAVLARFRRRPTSAP